MKRLVPCLLVLSACGEAAPTTAVEWGEALFSDPALSASQFNRFSCATCHQTSATPDPSRIDAGYSLWNVTKRPSWWGGYEADLIDAASFCYVYFMRGLAPLDAEDPKSKALYEWLDSISPDASAPALPLTIVKNVADVPRGDPARGREVYEGACQVCHGAYGSGDGRISDAAVVLPSYFDTFAETFPTATKAEVVVEKVRHGQFFLVGGNMPFYSVEALSDADLGALLAYFAL
ncbi:c-type cytochrome [Myxococcota bacterium]|nr:c-type cytochrome [Myxococcota bacterium]